MKIDLSGAVGPVRAAMMAAAEKSSVRRLNVYADEIRCSPGCASCCSRMIYVTVAEALVILGGLRKSGNWQEVKKRCLEQKATAYASSPVSWFKMNIPCPVLRPEEKTCSAYEVRPALCSTHFVRSEPSACDPWDPGSAPYSPVQMDDILDEFKKALAAGLDGFGVLAYRMPMPVALLFAERVGIADGITLSEAVRIMRTELP